MSKKTINIIKDDTCDICGKKETLIQTIYSEGGWTWACKDCINEPKGKLKIA